MQYEDQIAIRVGPSSIISPDSIPLPLFAPAVGMVTRARSHKPVRCDGLLVFVWAETLEAILAHGQSGQIYEVGGWLLGRYASDGDHSFVLVEVSLPAKGGGKSPVGFRFTNEDQREMADLREKRYPHLLVVGWYHSHPLGMQLSETDKQAHRSVFREPFQIAMVMSPGGQDIGCSVWSNGEISEVGGFFVLEKGSP